MGRSNRISACILFAAIAGAPLLFGSRDPATVAFWCGLLGAGLLLSSPRHLSNAQGALLAGVAVIVAGYGFVLHEQLADHAWIAAPHPQWSQASDLLGRPLTPSVSIVRGEPFHALGKPLVAALGLTLGIIVGADRTHARRGLFVMAWSGVAYAVYGIVSLIFEPTMILWREKTAYVGSLTATFINRNTAATYFGSCSAVWLILLLDRVRGRLPRGPIVWTTASQYLLTNMPTGLAIRLVMFFLCLAALFMTGSRAGVIVSLLGLVIATVLFFRRDLPRGNGIMLALLGTAAVALVLLEFLGGNIGHRIDVQGLSDAGRLAAYRSTLRMIADHPWFGTGLGTFASAFPAYRSGEISLWGVWDRAHSTPLELAAELGLPLAAMVLIGWLVAIVLLFRATHRRRSAALIPLAAFAVAIIALLHSMIDFSLQITGYAIVAFALVGVGLAQSLNDANDEQSYRQAPAESASASGGKVSGRQYK